MPTGAFDSGGAGGDGELETVTDPGVTTDDPDQGLVRIDDDDDEASDDVGIYTAADDGEDAADDTTDDVLAWLGLEPDLRAGPGGVEPGSVDPDVTVGVGGVTAATDETGVRIRGRSVNRTAENGRVYRRVYVNGQPTQDASDTIPPYSSQTWVMDVDADDGCKKVVEVEGTNHEKQQVASVGSGELCDPPGEGLDVNPDGSIPDRTTSMSSSTASTSGGSAAEDGQQSGTTEQSVTGADAGRTIAAVALLAALAVYGGDVLS